jgi:hypothetical protein
VLLSCHAARAVAKGDRVAQLILERIATPDVVEARPSRAAPRTLHANACAPRAVFSAANEWLTRASSRALSLSSCRAHAQVDDLDATERGAGGFGSTGVSKAL